MVNSYEIIDYATKACVVPSIFLNVLLIILSHRFSRSEIGTYRYIIILFSSCQILLSSFHFCINPKVLVLPGIFSVVSDSAYDSKLLTIIHYTSTLIPNVVIIFLCLYRYWVVRRRVHRGNTYSRPLISRPYNIGNFSSAQFVLQWSTVVLVVLFTLTAAIVWIGMMLDPHTVEGMIAEFHRKYGRTVDTGWVVFQYRRRNGLHLPSVLLTIIFDFFSIAFIISTVILALLTFNYVSIAFALSPFTKNIHTRLLATIGLQVFVTVVFVSLPSLLNTTLPILGCPFSLIADVAPLLNALNPSLEALVIIMLSKSYRRGLVTLFSRNHRRDTIQSPFLVTVAKTSF